jgi:hypothetical protein
MVRELLLFFKVNNIMYADVDVDNGAVAGIDADTSICEHLFADIEDPEAAAAVDAEQESIAGHSHNDPVTEGEDECRVIERNVLLAEEASVVNTSFVEQRVVDLNQHEVSATPRVRVEHSSRFVNMSKSKRKCIRIYFPSGGAIPMRLAPPPYRSETA